MSCVAHKVVKQPVNVYPVSSVLDSGCDRPRGILPSSHSFYIFFTHLFFDNIILSFYFSVIIATKLILFFSEIRLDFLVSFFSCSVFIITHQLETYRFVLKWILGGL